MSVSKLIPLLESVKEMLAVKQDGPGTQKKPAQSNAASASAAKAKLAELVAKSKKGVTATTTVKTSGSKKR